MNDINTLMKDKHAYLEGNNQYEVGAKILLLTNIMNRALVAKKEKIAISGAFNCASGKDRTGMMDGILKTFALMTDKRGKCPTHQEFTAEGESGDLLRKEFTDILVSLLLESGVLEITYLNTGAKGLKVSEEARLFNLPLEDFLQMQGLSTTSSY
jgi:phosphatidylinositol-4,5-bisphosphate 4-phosphatase